MAKAQKIKLGPGKNALDLGSILNLFGILKDLASKYDVDWARIPDLFKHVATIASSDYHTKAGLKDAITSIINIADILVLSAETTASLKEALASDALLSLLASLVNLIDPVESSDDDDVSLPVIEALSIPDLVKWLPVLMELLAILRQFRG